MAARAKQAKEALPAKRRELPSAQWLQPVSMAARMLDHRRGAIASAAVRGISFMAAVWSTITSVYFSARIRPVAMFAASNIAPSIALNSKEFIFSKVVSTGIMV